MTLAALRMQVELGDHTSETPVRLKAVLKDYIPHDVKNAQSPREWLEDFCTIHGRMVGFEERACKENYIRLVLGYETFGYTMFTVRHAADPNKPHLNTKVSVGVSYRGLAFFDAHKQPYQQHPYNEIQEVSVLKTRTHIELNSGENLFFHSSVEAAAELGSLLEEYGAAVPKKKKGGTKLRTVMLGGEEEPEELEAPTEELDTAVASNRLAGPPIALEAPPLGERFGDRGLFDDDEEDDQGAGTGLFDRGGGSQADQLFA